MLLLKNGYDSEKDCKALIKQKKILDKLIAAIDNEINTLNQRSDYNNLTYCFKTKSKPISFSNFDRPLGFKRKIINGYIDLQKAKENQEEFKSNLSQIKREKPEHK